MTAPRSDALSAWPPPAAPRALVLVNEAAGGVGKGAREKMQALLGELGVEIVDLVTDVGALGEAASLSARADMVIVLGGDGTARAAAETFDDGPPLILLPGGTLNVLPRALLGQRAWPEALRAALREGRVTRLVGGRANGRKFFVAALFGAPTLLARAREAVREGRILAALGRLRLATNRMFSRKVFAWPPEGARRAAEGVGVLCPAYSGGIEDDALEWVELTSNGLIDFARVGLLSLVGGWRTDSSVEIRRRQRGEVRSRGVIPAVLDGEPTTFFARVRVEMLARGPLVIAADEAAP